MRIETEDFVIEITKKNKEKAVSRKVGRPPKENLSPNERFLSDYKKRGVTETARRYSLTKDQVYRKIYYLKNKKEK